ncbi:predicted unusual protein kinase regulating ubiquinone biosynthesis (AarF/ABC1/UbiB family) [Jatrophihabitans sp. GAS493]|uniref:ABC1 kinase family protein n=1 Tax=Jatrophihabitans sp. GAS493 TaxID=1907575 RepID=UPI000BB7DE02|nr:AarF/ABC1/UbiB kinase family protein [Jatrophihabitans sp. GAS493]SOD73191.1 predicted unusual protein kinase regulating ubiquinone biosynthesis (AarF/ABC1/UbiB family) [Jatrophihabitans sp. GAS493]
MNTTPHRPMAYVGKVKDGTDIPQRRVARTARLATLPLGAAGRATVGIGKRITGKSAEDVAAEFQQRTAEQLFTVLGELKGGAMKLGQALSIFEAALPEASAAPYREALTKLQDSAPPMPAATMHRVLDEQFGKSWTKRFQEFDDTPAAAASIGQVHKAIWSDGREVAVKIQYPGAGPALMADFTQLSRLAWLFGRMSPGMDVKPLISELKERILEELDYGMEADAQRGFAKAYADDPDILVGRVVASAPKVLVTEWIDGTPVSEIIDSGTQAQRDRAGYTLALLQYSSPERAGLLHADPHPGNFRISADGRLGVLDFGAVARLPNGSPKPLGRMTRLALDGRKAELIKEMTEFGFIRPGIELDAQQVLDYLRPILDPLTVENFTFTRDWMRSQAARIGDPRNEEARVGRMFNLPPDYLLLHRVSLGSIAVLCQLGATAPYRALAQRWQPGFAE